MENIKTITDMDMDVINENASRYYKFLKKGILSSILTSNEELILYLEQVRSLYHDKKIIHNKMLTELYFIIIPHFDIIRNIKGTMEKLNEIYQFDIHLIINDKLFPTRYEYINKIPYMATTFRFNSKNNTGIITINVDGYNTKHIVEIIKNTYYGTFDNIIHATHIYTINEYYCILDFFMLIEIKEEIMTIMNSKYFNKELINFDIIHPEIQVCL